MNLDSLFPHDSEHPAIAVVEVHSICPASDQKAGSRDAAGDSAGSASTRQADPTLLKAVARGHKWFNELVSRSGDVHSRDRARESGSNERFVRRLIPLAFLSPAIVQAIAEGRHPGQSDRLRF